MRSGFKFLPHVTHRYTRGSTIILFCTISSSQLYCAKAKKSWSSASRCPWWPSHSCLLSLFWEVLEEAEYCEVRLCFISPAPMASGVHQPIWFTIYFTVELKRVVASSSPRHQSWFSGMWIRQVLEHMPFVVYWAVDTVFFITPCLHNFVASKDWWLFVSCALEFVACCL